MRSDQGVNGAPHAGPRVHSAITRSYFTVGRLKRTSQLIFLHQRLMEQGSAAMTSRGRARAAVPVTGCCRHRRRAAAVVALGGLTGGQRCRRTTSGAARCGWHTSGEGRSPRGAGSRLLDASLPVSTMGGPTVEPSCRSALQHQIRQWSLPPPCLSMSMGFRRLRSAWHLDGLHLRTRRFVRLHSCRKMPLEAVEQQLCMEHMRMCVLVSLRARFLRD
mmetsp:Transcript_51610/g.102712  ORF Transcript_51610/g.102712 Transcript_51610/m.102712 type:complete len:218 (+) Transcript_51610:389-1042(+)